MKQINPIENLFPEIKKILDFIELKNNKEALLNENESSYELSEIWINAKREEDSFLTYSHLWEIWMFQQIQHNVLLKDIIYWKQNPYELPLIFRDTIHKLSRNEFLKQYKETNDYYRKLNGLPSTKDHNYIYPSEELIIKYKFPNKPIHELSDYWQNIYIKTDEYKNVLQKYPNKEYLKYLGIYKIDMYVARIAKDFDIIRYPYNLSNINPNLLSSFSKTYNDCRQYVMVVLYNKQLEDVYPGYREFIGLLIMAYTLMQISNKSINTLKNWNFFDDSILYHLMELYNIPINIQSTKDIRRLLVRSIPKLIKQKGTDEVYQEIINILDYKNVKVNKLVLYKDPNKNVKFLKVDINDKNPYKTISSNKVKSYNYNDITEKDPYWINTKEVLSIIKDSSYNISDSKYITLDVLIQQSRYMMESILFPRMILDNKFITDKININLYPLLNYEISLFDLVLYLIIENAKHNKMNPKIIYETEYPESIYGFNFDINIEELKSYINRMKYVDKNKILRFINSLYMINVNDLTRVFNNIIPMQEWFERKIMYSTNKEEYNEYINLFKSLFTYDITKNSFTDDFKKPIQMIKEKYNISDEELDTLISFYPNKNNISIKEEEFNANRNITDYKYPFLSIQKPIDWYIDININTQYGEENRGKLYFYDLLSCDNCLLLTNKDGTRLFMDYQDQDIGWQINKNAINKALELLNAMDINALSNAYFQINSYSRNGKLYDANTMLPKNIRSLYKDILIEKFTRDTNGESEKPVTYEDLLKRKNTKFYNDIINLKTYNRNTILSTMVNKMESLMDIHLKYFEQFILGNQLFFNPLIELIKRFKSNFVDIADVDYKYIFDDKIDSSGSACLKLFDIMGMKFDVKFKDGIGLYDAEKKVKYHIILKDRSEILSMVIGEGFLAEKRDITMGSIHLVDEVKFMKNKKLIDPDNQTSHWISGEYNIGRWDNDFEHLMKARKKDVKINNGNIDLEGWKDFVPSYNQP